MAIKFGFSAWNDYVVKGRDDLNAPIVLCFGDSWFWYPIPGIGNISFNLLNFGRAQAIDIVSLGENGMEISSPGKNILADLTAFLQWESKTIDMIAISGGGNDFVGPEDLDPLLKKGKDSNAESWFKGRETDELLANVTAGFKKIIHLRNTFCPNVPIVTHCYDYAQVSGQGLLWFSPWIKPSFDKIGMPPALHKDAVKFIIDHIAYIQESLSENESHYIFLNTRNTLGPDDWSNELHPTNEGFKKISSHFYKPFKEYFPDWVVEPKWLNKV